MSVFILSFVTERLAGRTLNNNILDVGGNPIIKILITESVEYIKKSYLFQNQQINVH